MRKQVRLPDQNASSDVTGGNSQITQLRRNLEKEVTELKKQIHQLQQDSLKTLQDNVQSILNTQSSENLQLLAKKDMDVRKQMEWSLKDAEKKYKEAMEIMSATVIDGNRGGGYFPEQSDFGEQAIESAIKSVLQAMQSADKSVAETEKLLSNLGEHNVPDY